MRVWVAVWPAWVGQWVVVADGWFPRPPPSTTRPAVVARKVCGGNRSERGAHTHAVLASVLRTIQQRQLDAGEIFSELLRSAESITALATDERVRTPHSTEAAPLAADRHRK